MLDVVPLEFLEDDVTWVTLKLSGASGELGAEGIDPRNWLLRFRCALEEFRVVVANMDYWMSNSSPPWDYYRALMKCHLVALDKRLWVIPVGKGEMIQQAIAKIVMREAGHQEKMACRSLQLCVHFEAGTERLPTPWCISSRSEPCQHRKGGQKRSQQMGAEQQKPMQTETEVQLQWEG